MTKTTKTTSKKVTNELEVTSVDSAAEVVNRQTAHDMFMAAFVVSVIVNVFILTVWLALNVAGSEAATLSVVLGR